MDLHQDPRRDQLLFLCSLLEGTPTLAGWHLACICGRAYTVTAKGSEEHGLYCICKTGAKLLQLDGGEGKGRGV